MPRPLTKCMADARIIAIALDERSILKRGAEIEQERRVAIFDLLEANRFAVVGRPGPYRLRLRVEDGRLAIELLDESGAVEAVIRMGLGRFRRPIRDYFLICDSYFKAVRTDSSRGIEAIDMARRGQHNAAAELLQECLKEQVEMDFDTARRLFTLLCVLHIKATPTALEADAA